MYSAFGIEHGEIAKSFSESKDHQSVTYKDKKGGKTKYKVNRYDTSVMDRLEHGFATGSIESAMDLPDRSFRLQRSEGRPRPFKGAKAEAKHYTYGNRAPKKMNVYRMKDSERASERNVNTAVGGAVGGIAGAGAGATVRGAKGAVIGGLGGAAAGAGAGRAWRPSTHKLTEPRKK